MLAVRDERRRADRAAHPDAEDGHGLVAQEAHDGRHHHPAQVVQRLGVQEFLDAFVGGDHGLGARRQRGVAYCERFVVLEVAQLLLTGEGVTADEQGQHQVGLLDDLLAVQIEVGVMQEQVVVVGRRVLEVPYLV